MTMDWKTFFASLVRWGAWPAVVLVLVSCALGLFRRQLGEFIEGVEEFAIGNMKLKRSFRKSVELAEEVAPDTITGKLEATEKTDTADLTGDARQLAIQHPDMVVSEAFQEIVRAGLEYRSLPGNEAANTYALISKLQDGGQLPAKSLDLYQSLKETRRRAIQRPRQISPAQALEFRSACVGLAALIRSAMKKTQHGNGDALGASASV
jgi:hypothetical protein